MYQQQSEFEIKTVASFTRVPKYMKYLGTNLTKDAQDPYPDDYRILPREMKEDPTECRDTLHSRVGRFGVSR